MADAEPIATVESFEGDVQVTDASGKTTEAITGARLFGGQMLQVGEADSRAGLVLADGTHVALSSGSTVRMQRGSARNGKQIHLEQGSLQIEANAQSSKRSLTVTTDHARIQASANRFRLYREEGSSRVELEEGSARLTDRAWSTAAGNLLLVLETGHRHVNRIALAADQSLLATVGDTDCVKVWEFRLP